MDGTLPERQDAVNRSAAGDAFSTLVVTVFQLDGALAAAGDALAQPAGQTSARWRVLAAVEHSPMSVAQIARAWRLARQSVQRVADLLERDGLVTYEDNPAHLRAKLVQLTPAGRSTLARIQAAQHTWANAAGERIGIDDIRSAQRILARVLEALGEQQTDV
jgi:DNA-binding MarR family transcriptional regulator